MERLFTGRPIRNDGKLTKQNLRREAGVNRATMNRATAVLADWDDHVSQSAASKHDQAQAAGIARFRRQLRDSRHERQRLQDEVDAAATVIAACYLLSKLTPGSQAWASSNACFRLYSAIPAMNARSGKSPSSSRSGPAVRDKRCASM